MRPEDLRVMMTEGEEGDMYRETTIKNNKKTQMQKQRNDKTKLMT